MKQISQRRADQGVLLVGPLSEGPLTGGVETGISKILNSQLPRTHRLDFFNTLRDPNCSRRITHRAYYQLTLYIHFSLHLMRKMPRVVHVKTSEGKNFAQGIVYCALARCFGCRTLLQIHGGSFDSWYKSRSRVFRAAIRAALHVPSEIIALSKYWLSFLSSLTTGRTIHVVPNGVKVENRLCGTPSHSPEMCVLSIGAVGRRKGYFDIVAAAARLRQQPIRFVLVGPDEFGGETDELRKRIHDLEIQDRIELFGVAGGPEKSRLLAEADVFLLPSHNENMPNAVLEAMAAGLPVVCTAVGSLPEMLKDGEGAIFVPIADPGAIQNALVRLCKSPQLREVMGRRNHQEVIRRFSFQRVVNALDALYSKDLR